MTVSDALSSAYRQTTYRVACSGSGPIDIRIGERNDALDRLLLASAASQWAFVSASNPQSRELSGPENARRNDALKRALTEAGWRYLDALGVPDNAGWQAEHSVLVLDITREAAIALARRWQQRAIVYGALNAAPELVWRD